MSTIPLKAHILQLSPIMPYPCHLCALVFYSSDSRQAHHSRVHAQEIDISGSDNVTVGLTPPPTKSKPRSKFKCKTCGKSLANKYNLRDHMATHSSRAKPFQCSTCGKALSCKRNFEAHMLIHSGDKPFQCSTCGKTFFGKKSLSQHAQTHSEERPFGCPTCVRKFTTKGLLNRHVLIHNEERSFGCPTCVQKFTSKALLTQHVQIHRKDTVVECPTCGKKFPSKVRLRSHMMIHREEKPFSCSVCGKAFLTKRLLRQHMVDRAHFEVRSSSSQDGIPEVMEIHSVPVEKIHPCPLCCQQFAFPSKLSAHLLIHSQDSAAFRCEICNCGFKKRKTLYNHRRILHKILGL